MIFSKCSRCHKQVLHFLSMFYNSLDIFKLTNQIVSIETFKNRVQDLNFECCYTQPRKVMKTQIEPQYQLIYNAQYKYKL